MSSSASQNPLGFTIWSFNKRRAIHPHLLKSKKWKMKVRYFLSIFNTQCFLINNLWTLVSSSALQNPLCLTIWNPNSSKWRRLKEGTNENVIRLQKKTYLWISATYNYLSLCIQTTFQRIPHINKGPKPSQACPPVRSENGSKMIRTQWSINENSNYWHPDYIPNPIHNGSNPNLHEWLTIDEL